MTDTQAPTGRVYRSPFASIVGDDTMRATFGPAKDWRGKHVVVINWRSSGHPAAGGAELYCESVAEELVSSGVKVTYLTARAKGQASREQTRFGRVVRGGGTLGVYVFVLLWLLLHRRSVDGVIDSMNGIPFLSPLTLRRRTPIVRVIHHVHQEQFDVWFPKPIARFGQFMEKRVAGWIYGRRTVCTVSPSSRAEIRRVLGTKGQILLAPCGMQMPAGVEREPAAVPRIVVVGRVVEQKRLDVLVRSFPLIAEQVPQVELHIVGSGVALPALQALVAEMGLGERVTCHGRVSEADRDALVASAWVTASASDREGWGLSTVESAASGVPGVALMVPGLRDAIRDGETGWLVDTFGSAERSLAAGIVAALRQVADPDVADEWARRCADWASRFTWAATADHLLSALTAEKQRLSMHSRENRYGTDDATLVVVPRDLAYRVRWDGLRVTDRVDFRDTDVTALLYGADEYDARRALHRLGVDLSDSRVIVQPARNRDLLGWRSGAPAATTILPSIEKTAA